MKVILELEIENLEARGDSSSDESALYRVGALFDRWCTNHKPRPILTSAEVFAMIGNLIGCQNFNLGRLTCRMVKCVILINSLENDPHHHHPSVLEIMIAHVKD